MLENIKRMNYLAILLITLVVPLSIAKEQVHPTRARNTISCTDCDYSNANTIRCIQNQFSDIHSLKTSCLVQYLNATTFIINGYKFNYFDESLFDSKMESVLRLELSNNQINFLNEKLFLNLPNLRELILDNNKLSFPTSNSYQVLSSVSKSLKTLCLNNAFNSSLTINNDLKQLIEKSGLTELNTIELKNNNLTSFNAANDHDFDILCLNKNLKHLHLESNLLEEISFRKACITDSNLSFLSLKGNKINDDSLNVRKSHNLIPSPIEFVKNKK